MCSEVGTTHYTHDSERKLPEFSYPYGGLEPSVSRSRASASRESARWAVIFLDGYISKILSGLRGVVRPASGPSAFHPQLPVSRLSVRGRRPLPCASHSRFDHNEPKLYPMKAHWSFFFYLTQILCLPYSGFSM